jgi:hypothetical protein
MSAVISDCGTFRYALTRGDWLGGTGTVLFVMLNPSTADASTDDATIRRCIGFAWDWGFARLTVANLFAYRATNPDDLIVAARAGVDPVGPDNDRWIVRLASGASQIVAAWGAHRAAEARTTRVLELLGPDVMCLGQTKSLAPRHPVRLRRDTPRTPIELGAMA